MINLLSESDKKKLRQEYLRRKIVVIGFLVFVVSLVGVALLFPAFWYLGAQEKNYKEQVDFSNQHFVLSDSERVISEVSSINFDLNVYKKNQTETGEVGWVVEKIINIKPKNVKIEGLKYDRNSESSSEKGETVVISGVSATRNGLLGFVDDLRGEKEFSSVVLPASNLLLEEDVDFSIVVEINKPYHESR